MQIGMPKMRAMKTNDAIAYYGGKTQLAAALGIKTPSIYDWGDIVPEKRQYQLERLTNGALKASWPPAIVDRAAA